MERVHGRDGEYACDKCGKTLNSADSLRMHMTRVHDKCEYEAAQKCTVKTHIESVHVQK